MSELQQEAIQMIGDMSEGNLKVLLPILHYFVQADGLKASGNVKRDNGIRIGVAEGKRLYAEGYDIDEYNDEIARMFGVTE